MHQCKYECTPKSSAATSPSPKDPHCTHTLLKGRYKNPVASDGEIQYVSKYIHIWDLPPYQRAQSVLNELYVNRTLLDIEEEAKSLVLRSLQNRKLVLPHHARTGGRYRKNSKTVQSMVVRHPDELDTRLWSALRDCNQEGLRQDIWRRLSNVQGNSLYVACNGCLQLIKGILQTFPVNALHN